MQGTTRCASAQWLLRQWLVMYIHIYTQNLLYTYIYNPTAVIGANEQLLINSAAAIVRINCLPTCWDVEWRLLWTGLSAVERDYIHLWNRENIANTDSHTKRLPLLFFVTVQQCLRCCQRLVRNELTAWFVGSETLLSAHRWLMVCHSGVTF